jgi:hypothetical protein
MFYSRINNRPIAQLPISQSWVTRASNALAFLFKTVLVSAIGIAYSQRLWFSARRQAIRIGSIDAMFQILTNPLMFFNIDIFRKTSILFGLAAVSWLLPLSAIVSPSALTSTPFRLAHQSDF